MGIEARRNINVSDSNDDTHYDVDVSDKKESNNVHKQVKSQISSLDSVDPKELDLSLRLKSSLDKIREKEKFNSFAIRCWPETFTEYGGAICAPVSM